MEASCTGFDTVLITENVASLPRGNIKVKELTIQVVLSQETFWQAREKPFLM